MPVDIEKTLARELREVAGGLNIPGMPPLPQERPRSARRWQPLLVAAAVATVVAGAAGVVTTLPDGRDIQPAQPSASPSPGSTPSPSPTESTTPIPREAPEVPYVLDRRLYVDGEQVQGAWWAVRPAGEAWIAWREDYTWWWGRGPEPRELPNGEDVTPQISPDGRYVAVVRAEDGEGVLSVVDTESGDTVGGTPVSIGAQRWDYPAYVVAVLDEGRVVIRREDSHLAFAFGSGRADVLSAMVPGQLVLGATAAGLVVTDDDGGQTYLAEISERGELSRTGELPEHEDLTVSPGGEWLAWTRAGATDGDVASVPTLEVRTLDGERPTTLTAPDGWEFALRTWVWEDDAHLVSTVWSTGERRERMARCRPEQARCILIEND